jgi:hypothetical protein
MKKIIFLIITFVMYNIGMYAQAKDSANVKTADEKKAKTEQGKSSSGEKEKVKTDEEEFIDENGDGINDNTVKKGKGRGRGNSDKFIDKDGDGINDNRCNGLGWGNQGKMKKYGKRGK